jgi:ligand-binding sensor domain-containing protein
MKRFLFVIPFLLLSLNGRTQVKVGEWQDQLAFGQAISLVESKGIIWCATRSGLFSYDPLSGETSKWSKINGLSDVEIACLAFSEEHNTLIIAYANSNLDLLRNNQIINIPDIKRKPITGSKRINSIQVDGNEALLSCGFGIIRLNLLKNEVSSTYYIGPGGSHIEVYETLFFHYDSIFAATSQGIFKASKYDPDLENYRNWHPVTGQPFKGEPFNHMAYDGSTLWASHLSQGSGIDSIFTYNGYQWNWYPRYYNDIRRMRFIGDQLVVVSSYQVNFLGADGTQNRHIDHYGEDIINPADLLLDKNGKCWIADRDFGLIYSEDYVEYTRIKPEGPWDRKTFDLAVAGGDLWIASGGYDASWNNIWNISGASARINGSWVHINPITEPRLGPIRDIVRLAVNPADPTHVFGATWGFGVVEFKDGEYVGVYDDTNTDGALRSVFPGNPYIRIGGLAFDSKNNLWVTNSSVPAPVSVRKSDGTWKSFSYGQYLGDAFSGKIVVTPGDIKWVQMPKGYGLYVFDNGKDLDDEKDDKFIKLSVSVLYPQNTVKILNDIYSMAVDLDGRLWLGTSNGAVLYYAPSRVFTDSEFYASQPSVDQGDNLYHGLLATEIITAIAVDGANRKWFGTRNSGVYLTNPEGTQLIQSFNVSNSPLLSNEIVSIAIDNDSGVVYFGTEAGVVSYRGTATSEDQYEGPVYAFPNPVRPGYTGPITVKGVPAESNVKITDLSGNLVFEGTSTGGQVIWDGNGRNGSPVVTGVYLVFAATSDQTRKSVAKILIVR